MPRYREPFTIFPRKLRSGKTVWYYRAYTPDGVRTTAHSTGKTNKTQARIYCTELLANGMLCTSMGMSFRVYAEHFYDDSSQWVQDKVQSANGKERPFARKTLIDYREYLNNKILPFFSKYKLSDIKPYHVRNFRTTLIEKGLSNSSINIICFCLKTILTYAVNDRYIKENPCGPIKRLSTNPRTRDAFSEKELVDIFGMKWDGDERRRIFAITAAVTGMRLSEILAIRNDIIHDEYIDLDRQYDCKIRELTPLKTGEARKIRIPKMLSKILRGLVTNNGFVFPEHELTYSKHFIKKIDESEKRKRGLCFHSLRHFFNTYMLANNISEAKVKSIMGHSSGKGSMTERYTNFRPEHFDDVVLLQEKLLEEFLGGNEYITPHLDH